MKSEAAQTTQNYSGIFSAGGNQYIGSTFNLSRGDVNINSQRHSDDGNWLRFLRSLRYDRIDERKNAIKENQYLTFEWALEDASTSHGKKCPLPDWFRNGQGTFLIQGKPGAGKSTLMKFLFEDGRTIALLKQFFNSENVYLLFHSFWCLGQDELQHNWKGILCSLTSQLADLHQSSARTISAQYPLKQSVHDWSERELFRLLFKLVETSTAAHCIFIDGLDELNHGDLDNIYDFIDRLTDLTSANCKVCVASRPMPDIESINTTSTFRIQDYTAEDIHQHAVKVLLACSHFNKRIPAEIWRDKTKIIAKTICDRAEGVFLWVEYVLQSVRKGLRISDDLDVIQKRISVLPSGIEQLYRHMLMLHQSDMEANADQVALIFGMSKFFPINLVQLAIACNHSVRKTYVVSEWLQRLGKGHLHDLASDFIPRLNVLSAGLIEWQGAPTDYVHYIHRTARDFLQNDTELPCSAFSNHMARQKDILQAYVESYLICLIEKDYSFSPRILRYLVYPIVQSESSSLDVLDTVDRVCNSLFQEIDNQQVSRLPNWVAFVHGKKRLSWEVADLAELIILCEPCSKFWNQFCGRRGVKWSRYYKGYLLNLAFERMSRTWIEFKSLLTVATSLFDTGADVASPQLRKTQLPTSFHHERSAPVAFIHSLILRLSDSPMSRDDILGVLQRLDLLENHINMEEDLSFLSRGDSRLVNSSYGKKWKKDCSDIIFICIFNARQVFDLTERYLRDCINMADKSPSLYSSHIDERSDFWLTMQELFKQSVAEVFCDIYIHLESREQSSDRLISCLVSSESSLAYSIVFKRVGPGQAKKVLQSLSGEGLVCVPNETRIADLVFIGPNAPEELWTVDPTKDVGSGNWREAYTFYE